MTTKVPRSLGTHDGTFHADEVLACALLLLTDLIDLQRVVRTRDPQLLKTCEYVADVGGIYDPKSKRFDHHQVDYQGPLASAGMVLLHLRDSGKMSEEEYTHLRDALVVGVDAHDNGKSPQLPGICTFSHLIGNFNPIRYDADSKEYDGAFQQAVLFTLGHLQRWRDRHIYTTSCRDLVRKAMAESEDLLVFDVSIPWQDGFFESGGEDHPATFVVMPSGEHWKLRGIPPNMYRRMETRKPLPAVWAGLLDQELQTASGIPGAIFCHKGRFISVWKTKEDALMAFEAMRKIQEQGRGM